MRDRAERGVVVEAAPRAAFVVVEANLLLEVLIVALDTPAELDATDQFSTRNRAGQRRQVELRWSGFFLGPLANEHCSGPGGRFWW